ncbi:MAG TPA: AAA family ATPase [Candidatus Polarisedimenticolaceae bacterium]|nr:AAA family ATPase [Candidatus Polarisedimenticolaceae bacterium]
MSALPGPQEHKAMLHSHFGFREMPFGVTPDPRFFYSHPHYLEGLAALVHGIEAKKGFMLVTGEVGTGKTILLRKLMRHLDGSVQFVFVSNSHLTSYGLTELIVQNLAISNKEKSRLEMLQDLNNYLVQQLRSFRTVALLVDEAQKLSDEALEGLCDLSNLETDEEKLLQIVLVGQPEVAIKLSKPSLRRIKQRITLHHRLYSLQTPTEVDHYISHRLEIVGYSGPEIFTREAVEAIWQYSGGTPRLINILCDNTLAIACLAAKKKVSAYMIMKTAAGLLMETGLETPKASADAGFLRMKIAAPRTGPRRSETNGSEITVNGRASTPPIPLRESDRVKLSRIATKGPAVSLQFFDRMTRAATEAMGPMANRIVVDQISALGESRQAFPQGKLAELVMRVSVEILNESMRDNFQRIMVREIATLKTM